MELPDHKTTFGLSLVGGLSVLALLFVFLSSSAVPTPAIQIARAERTVLLDPELIKARAAVLYDATTGEILYEKNAEAQLPLASLTKLMAVATVLAVAPKEQVATIKLQDLAPDGDWHFRVGEVWPLADLLRFGLVASSNDAIAAAAASIDENIISAMNRTAGELGLTHTYFLNPTGLDVDTEMAGAYGSARDVAVLASVFLREYPVLFEATARPKVSIHSGTHTLTATSTAGALISIPGFIGAKTGYTDLAGGNLVAAFDLEVGRPVMIAVLGSTREGRFEDVRTIIEAAHTQL